MPQKVLIKRTSTNNSPPTTLDPGELAVEMGTPTRLWVGVPTAIDPTGKKQLTPSTTADIWVDTTGDTMTGDLILPAAPAADPNAAINQVNADARYVNVTGDTMSGALIVRSALAAPPSNESVVTDGFGANLVGINCYATPSQIVAMSDGYSGFTNFNVASGVWQFSIAPSVLAGQATAAAGKMYLYENGDMWVKKDIASESGVFRSIGALLTDVVAVTIAATNSLVTLRPNGAGVVTGQAYVATDGTFVISSATALKPGGGPWADSSDARIKNVEGNFTRGLAEINQLRPVTYTYKGNDTREAPANNKGAENDPVVVPYPNSTHFLPADDQQTFTGLVAQEVESVFPEMVSQTTGYIDGVQVNDIRVLDANALTYALINAVKELSARVEALEANAP